jgi:hypothetical protein
VHAVITLEEFGQLALALPEVTEGERWRNLTWYVDGKSFAWERPLSKADIKRYGEETPPDGPIAAVSVADLSEKEALLAENFKGVFTISHFDSYPAVLIQLRVAGRRIVKRLLEEAWLAGAPAALAADYLSRGRSR